MAIATLLFSTLILKATGDGGAHGMHGAIAIGSIICIVAAISGDTSQDLKTGYLLGATPKNSSMEKSSVLLHLHLPSEQPFTFLTERGDLVQKNSQHLRHHL